MSAAMHAQLFWLFWAYQCDILIAKKQADVARVDDKIRMRL